MAYEIYYTSAQQGLKRGAQGFCTVAATEGIPAPLLQRLEALSGYRHHFGPGDTTGGRNPVTHAHWTLSLSGKTYYVLSRISDAGFDYTHRTNSLAHHIALEADELPPAGPAWLLAQAGIMIDHWNGQVGPITRPVPLPFQDAAPAVCKAWQRLTGDAGWGGVLADAFSKSASKPVCILFSPEQNILELIAESIGLLPPAQRWQATFNTYFTSMPTSVVCAWRCCLAGTPAALTAARYATGGVVINLADPASLGTPPVNAWTTAARTGIAVAGKAPPRTAAESAKPAPMPVLAGPPLELAPEKPRPLDLAAVNPHPSNIPIRTPRYRGPGMLDPHAPAPTEIDLQAQRHRRQMMLLYAAAVLAVGVGIGLLYWANRPVVISTPVPPSPTPQVFPTTQEAPTQPIVEAPATKTPVTQPLVVERPTPTTHPDIPPIIIKNPTPPLPPPVVAPEPTIVLHSALDRATGGSGLHDIAQTIELLPVDAAKLRRSDSLNIVFPGERTIFNYKHGELDGMLVAVPAHGASRREFHGVNVQWKDRAAPTATRDVLHISFNKPRTAIEVTWKSSLMLRRPDVGALTYWIMQNSHILASEPGKPLPHRLAFLAPELPPIDLHEPATTLHFPGDFPPDCLLAAKAGQLPAGWQATTIPDDDPKNPALQTLMFTKHTHVAVLDAIFHLTIRSGWTSLESDFADQAAHGVSSLEKFQKDLAEVEDQLKSAKSDAEKAPLLSKQHDFNQLCLGFREANTALADLKSFDLSVILPDGTAIATLHFLHK